MRKASLLVILVSILMATSQLMAQGRGKGPGKGRGGRGGGMMLQALNLTPDQQTKLLAFKKEHKNKMHSLNQEKRDLRHRLQDGLSNKSLDVKALNQIAEDIGKNEAALIKLKISHLQDLREILNDDQIEKLNLELMLKKGPGGKGRKGKGFKGGKGRGRGRGQGRGKRGPQNNQ